MHAQSDMRQQTITHAKPMFLNKHSFTDEGWLWRCLACEHIARSLHGLWQDAR